MKDTYRALFDAKKRPIAQKTAPIIIDILVILSG